MKKHRKPFPRPRDLRGTIRRQPAVFTVYLVLRLIVLATLVSSSGTKPPSLSFILLS